MHFGTTVFTNNNIKIVIQMHTFLRDHSNIISLYFLWPNFNIFVAHLMDWAERYDVWPRLWLFLSPFLNPSKKERRRKGEWLGKIVIKRHTVLLDYLMLWVCLFTDLILILGLSVVARGALFYYNIKKGGRPPLFSNVVWFSFQETVL